MILFIILIGDMMKYLLVFGKSLFFYLLITVVYRIMGKREIGELSIMDFIVSIFIAELAAISIENYNDNMFLSIIPIAVLVVLQIFSAKLSLKSENVRSLIDGNPSVIINRGKVNFEEMLKQRYNLDDLLTQIRDKGIKSLDEIEYAVLENNGKLSTFLYEDKKVYPMPLILDGVIQYETLNDINKNKEWLMKILKSENVNLDKVFYAFYKNNKCFIIRKNN